MQSIGSPRAAAGAALLVLALLSGAALADGRVTEETMTQKDYNEISKTETSEAGSAPVPVDKVHNFGPEGEREMKTAHGVKVMKGKDWKALSPDARDRALRELRNTTGNAKDFILEVPSGNLWVIASRDEAELVRSKTLRYWSDEEREKLPRTVKRDASPTHSDRNGTKLERALDVSDEP